jgi:hypothetical protein
LFATRKIQGPKLELGSSARGGLCPFFSGNRFSLFSQPGDPKWLALRMFSKLLKCVLLMNPQQNGMNDEV